MKSKENSLSEFAAGKNATKANFKAFCRMVFDAEARSILGSDCKLLPKIYVVNLPTKNNGVVYFTFINKIQRFTVLINLYHFLRAKDCSDRMKYVYLYATIVHELEHIRLSKYIEKATLSDYFDVLAAWDQFSKCRGIGRDVFSYFLIPKTNRIADKRGLVSPAEIYCNIKGFSRASYVLDSCLSMHEKTLLVRMTSSLEFIAKNLEISYDGAGRAVGLFVRTINQMRIFLRYNKHRAGYFPLLNYLINENGMLISADAMMNTKRLPERYFYDAVLIRMFIFWDCDWNDIFAKTEGLHERIAILANEYCQRSIGYLSNKELAKVFLSEEIVQDNAAMLVKNIHTIKSKMKQYNMPNTVGGVIPLYGI